MKVKRNLVQLVQSDYTPLQTSAEGLLRGGFGSIAVGKAIHWGYKRKHLQKSQVYEW